MNSRTLIIALACVLGVAALVWMAQRRQAVLLAGLPPRVEHANAQLAELAAGSHAMPIAGTGSMAPYIPAALPGHDPMEIVAYITPKLGATWADVTPGALVIYTPKWHPGNPVIHQAAAKDAGGWIMTGLHNENYENWERMTEQNFVALVAATHVWPLKP